MLSSLSPQLLLSLVAKESKDQTRSEITRAIKSEGFGKLGKLVKALTKEESARQLKIATAFFVDQKLADG